DWSSDVCSSDLAQCVTAGACTPPAYSRASFYPDYYGNPEYDDYPVLYVNWYQADEFCTWREGRLPSEAEWERAASFDPEQGIKTVYPWGDNFDGSLLNYCDANCYRGDHDTAFDDGYRDTCAVGAYPDGRSRIGAC